MTALKKYLKLECPGLWREGAQAQRREVIVNLGDTSLVLSDPKQEVAMAHWSLPAVLRLNPGELPALYSPDPDAGELLELDDADMINALETVHAALRAARPRPGRLRNGVLAMVALAIVAGSVLWLPEALVQHTASVLPMVTRAEIGQAVLTDLTSLTGQPCGARRGQTALTQLGVKIFGSGNGLQLLVLRVGLTNSLHLPGRQILLSEALLAEQDGPDLVAGFVLAERIALEQQDPMIALLNYTGLRATFQLLTTGVLPEGVVAGYAESLLKQPHQPLSAAILLPRFEAAGVASTPYATALGSASETVSALIEADPFGTVAPPQLLSDEDWISLQDICTN
ncbi:MAG: hypothetical protein ACJASV_001682 [Pseudorhodobacter sp.]|jgi:hypothetical protein